MAVKLLTIKDIRLYLEKELSNIYDANEAASLFRIILKTIFKPYGLHKIYDPQFRVDEAHSSEITGMVQELKTGKPYQYVLGETEFFGFTIKVTPEVLIPRPETEELVDLVIRENKDFKGEIIDFGTGSGCIAIAIAGNISGAAVTGVDISEKALEIARLNASLNNTEVSFEKNDILDFKPKGKKPGIIVSNPPYVRQSEKVSMRNNVLDFEPAQALFVDDSDPLVFYRKILETANEILIDGGKVYFEINEALGIEILELFGSFGYKEKIIIKDLNNRDRFAKAFKNE
ncbi:MAG TPA: peptide chain release factor N(5)-glutamine methyltransferase [Bacteroidales bacterium]|nr:peptide chain release factor N(5)-glutamine methyltransferase [Bacteroidales bacterium]